MQRKQSYKRRKRKETVRCAFCLTRKQIKRKKKKIQKEKKQKRARAKKKKQQQNKTKQKHTFNTLTREYSLHLKERRPHAKIRPPPLGKATTKIRGRYENVTKTKTKKNKEEQLKTKNMLSPRFETTRFDKRAAQSASPRLVP